MSLGLKGLKETEKIPTGKHGVLGANPVLPKEGNLNFFNGVGRGY